MHIRMTLSIFSNLLITVHALTCWEWFAYLTIDLEPVLLGILVKKILNPNSIPNKNVVSYERYGLLGGIRWSTHNYAYPIHPHIDFSKSMHKKRGKLDRVSCITSVTHHLYQSRFLLKGGLLSICEIFFSVYVVRCYCKFLYRIAT